MLLQARRRIVAAPESAEGCLTGPPATFAVRGEAADNWVYVWQIDSGAGFSDVVPGPGLVVTPSGGGSTLSVTPSLPLNGSRVRVRVGSVPIQNR